MSPIQMLRKIEQVMIHSHGDQHPWIAGADAKPLLTEIRKVLNTAPQYIYTDGTPVPEGKRVRGDHSLTTFTVTVRSMKGMTADTLKDAIQKQFEVTDIEVTGQTLVCHPA